MLKDLNMTQVRFVAILARAARTQRDEFLGNVPEADLGEVSPERGEHNPTAALSFETTLPEGAPQPQNLREAIATLSEPARRELYTLVRIGQGHLAADKWYSGLAEAESMGDETVTAIIMDDPDLHDHLAKGLYEAGLATR